MAAGRARASIRGLTGLVPDTALLEGGGTTERVSAASLRVGATVLVRPGDRIPADGTILAGESAVDEAPVSGESVPRRKVPGDAVFAGTVNGDGTLRCGSPRRRGTTPSPGSSGLWRRLRRPRLRPSG